MRHYIRNVSKTLLQNHNAKTSLIRFLTTQEGIERRHHLFTLEKKRQMEKVGRVEKIEVKYKGVPKECTLVMNKDISTPYDCAQHLSQWHMEKSALALIDDTVHWDMHRPLHENCTLEVFQHKMCEQLTVFKQGAEAKLYVCNYLGRPTLIKERFKKNYRHPDLDATITKERIKSEARSIVRCQTAEVRTPALYLVDFERRRIYMEHFENSITIKDFIINVVKKNMQNGNRDCLKGLDEVSKLIGQTVRKLHENNIIHGDLTTSNMLLIQKSVTEINDDIKWLQINNLELVMIDFGLSHIDTSTEDKGVDLYVLERAIISTHNDFPELFGKIFDAYKNYSKNNVKEIISKYEEVRARGRKRTMVG